MARRIQEKWGEGVEVRRPEVDEFERPYQTPDFESPSAMYAAMPRDVMLVLGNEIVEAPMAWRSRFFEYRPYRKLIKESFLRSAKWTAAPKGQMGEESFSQSWEIFDRSDPEKLCGEQRDIFGQQSQLINPTRPCHTGEDSRWCQKLPSMFKGRDPSQRCSVRGGPSNFLNSSEKDYFDRDKKFPCFTSSPWTATTNVLLLGEGRVVCESSQLEMSRLRSG